MLSSSEIDDVPASTIISPICEVQRIREQLARVLADELFLNSIRMSRFLRYIVEQTLDGEQEGLKESCIGVAVYDRSPSYDPKEDPVVRNEARRLRHKLEQYYDGPGSAEIVRISVPKGGYAPHFSIISETHQSPINKQLASIQTVPPSSPVQNAVDRVSMLRIVIVALLLIIVFGISWFLSRSTFTTRTYSQFTPEQVAPLTTSSGLAFDPAISPDGHEVAFAWNGNSDNANLYIVQKGGQPLQITHTATQNLRPAWSPNGKQLAFFRGSPAGLDAITIDFPGGVEKRAFSLRRGPSWNADSVEVHYDRGPIWSPNGSALFVSDQPPSGHGLTLFEHFLNSNQSVQITHPQGEERDLGPAFSPDGQWLAFARFSSHSAADIFLIPATGGQERKILGGHYDIRGIAWLPDSRHLIFSSNRLGTYSLWSLDVQGGQPTALVTSGEEATEPSVPHKDYKIVYVDSTYSSNIVRVPINSSVREATTLFPSSRRSNSAQFSPDGRQIAFTSDRSGAWEIWVANADGTNLEQLTHFNGPMVGSPRWSADGKSIVFDARPKGNSSIYIVASNGESIRDISHNNFEERQPFWSHDGYWIYFDSDRGGRVQLWRVSPSGKDASLVCDEPGFDVQETPNNHTLYFTTDKPGLWAVSSSGGYAEPTSALEQFSSQRLWYVTGKGIFFIEPDEHARELQFYDFSTGKISDIEHLPVSADGGTPSLSIAADGKSLLITNIETARSNLMTILLKRR